MKGRSLVWESIVLVLSALCLYVFLFSSSLRLLTTKTFIVYQQKRLNVHKDVGLSFEKLEEVDNELIKFIYSNKEFPMIFRSSSMAKDILLFSKEEVMHLYDVRNLFQKFFLMQRFTFIFLLGFLLLTKRLNSQHLFKVFSYVGAAIISVISFFFVFILIDFDKFFNLFHSLFFKPGTWVFTSGEMLPRLFPQSFWLEAAIILIGTFITEIAILILLFMNQMRTREGKRLNQQK